jgi:HK97 family phage major capsid protein
MKTSLKLKEERASLISDLEALVDSAKTEEREFTQQEETRQSDLNESIFSLDEKIANAEKTEAIMARSMAGAASQSEEVEMAEHAKAYSLRDAINQFTNGGRLEGREAEMAQEARNEFQAAGVSPSGHIQIPMGMTTRAISDYAGTTGTQEQGVLQGLVPESQLEAAGAKRITGVAGTVRLPSLPIDGTAKKNENAPASEASAMPVVDIDPVRIASLMAVSNQMLAASTNTFDAAVASQFRKHSGGLIDKEAFANFVTQGDRVLRSTSTAGAVPDIDFVSCNDLIAAMGTADALNSSAAFFASHGQLAVARSEEAISGGGIPFLSADNRIAGYRAFAHSQIDGEEHPNTALLQNAVFANGTTGSVTNESDLEAFFMLNMDDVYCCYWGGADLVVDNVTRAHEGVTRLIMNYYANCKVGHAASAKYVSVA